MSGTIPLKTERLTLRRYRLEDADHLYSYFGTDEKMYEFSGWNPYETREMAANTVRQFMADYEKAHFYGCAVQRKGELIGTVGAYDYDPDRSSIELGISIKRDCWGEGYASEVLRCVLNYLTDEEGIQTVTAWCAAENIGSRNAMVKAGMMQTSVEPAALVVGAKRFDKLNFVYRARR